MCSVGCSDCKPARLPQLGDDQERGDLTNARLDRRETDEFRIELFEDVVDLRVGD